MSELTSWGRLLAVASSGSDEGDPRALGATLRLDTSRTGPAGRLALSFWYGGRGRGAKCRSSQVSPVAGSWRRPRPKRWADAIDQLRTLQAEYEVWREQLPESLADSRTAELLEGLCDVDLDALDVELPRGFGRD